MRKVINKILAFVLVLTFIFPMSVQAQNAGTDEVLTEETEVILPRGLQDIPQALPDPEAVVPEDSIGIQEEYDETELLFQVEEKVKTAILEGKTKVDITSMEIRVDKYQLYKLRYFSPYLSNGIDMELLRNPVTNCYTNIIITNPMSLKETREYFSEVESSVDEIVSLVPAGMSEEETALFFHDYFGCEYEYDYENLKNDTLPDDSFRSGGLFMKKIGVCQAYAYAYMYIMEKLGIECYVTSSDEMGHAWNIINIDGSYYHVDVTWDDPVADRLGLVNHKYFLLSDTAIKGDETQGDHYGWDLTDLVCNNTKYDDAYWRDIMSPIVLADNHSYYIRGTSLYVRDLSGQTERALKNLGRWYVWNSTSSYWPNGYSGLFLYNNMLYYNTSTEIRKISLDGQTDTLVYTLDSEIVADGYIYGMRRLGEKIEYIIKQNPNESTGELFSIDISMIIETTDISLDKTELTLEEGDSETLTYTLLPEGAEADVKWHSNDETVVTVDSNGKVLAVSPGATKITATTDNGKSAECQVTVTKKEDLPPVDPPKDDPLPDNPPQADPPEDAPPQDDPSQDDPSQDDPSQDDPSQDNPPQDDPQKKEMPFADVASADWYYDSINYVYQNALMTGLNETTFGPVQYLARAQFSVILYRMNESPEITYIDKFPDVKEGVWYTNAILWANSTGVVNGYSDTGLFGPGDNINREQMAVMMYRYAKYQDYDVSQKADFSQFVDASRVNSFAEEAMQWAVGTGIITGKDNGTKLDPQGNASRAECATIIMRFKKYYE